MKLNNNFIKYKTAKGVLFDISIKFGTLYYNYIICIYKII